MNRRGFLSALIAALLSVLPATAQTVTSQPEDLAIEEIARLYVLRGRLHEMTFKPAEAFKDYARACELENHSGCEMLGYMLDQLNKWLVIENRRAVTLTKAKP